MLFRQTKLDTLLLERGFPGAPYSTCILLQISQIAHVHWATGGPLLALWVGQQICSLYSCLFYFTFAWHLRGGSLLTTSTRNSFSINVMSVSVGVRDLTSLGGIYYKQNFDRGCFIKTFFMYSMWCHRIFTKYKQRCKAIYIFWDVIMMLYISLRVYSSYPICS